MRQLICATLLALLTLSRPAAQSSLVDQQSAVALWEQAIAAKGGRDRLKVIQSFAVHEKTAFARPTLPEMAVGKVDQIVCALPDKWWEFLDYRPGEMGYSVTAANARTGLGWS